MLSSCGSKMLVHLMLLQVVCFCQAKSFNRGKRSHYPQGTDSQYQQFYDLRGSSAKPRNGFYYPQVDGRPIYIPPLGQSPQDMTELLDHYYNRKAWTLAPPTHDYDFGQNNYYENPSTSKSKTNYFDAVAEENRRGHSQALSIALNPNTDHKEPMKYEGQVKIIKTLKEKQDEDLSLPEMEHTIKIKDDTTNKIKSELYSSGMKGEDSEYYAPEVDKTKGKKTVLNNPNEESKEVDKHFTPEMEKFDEKKSGNKKAGATKSALEYSDHKGEKSAYYIPTVDVSHSKKYVNKGSEDETELTLEYAVDDEHERPISKSYKERVTTNVQKHKPETHPKSDGADYGLPVVSKIVKKNDKTLNKQQNKSTKEKQNESQAAHFEDGEYSIPAVKEKFEDEKPIEQDNFSKVKNKVVIELNPQETPVNRQEGEYVLPEASLKLKENEYELPEASLKLKESEYMLPEASLKRKGEYELPKTSLKRKEGEYQPPKTSLKLKEGEYELPEVSLKLKEGEYELPEVSLKLKEGEYELPEVSLKLKEGENELPGKSVKTKENVSGYEPTEVPKKQEENQFMPELNEKSEDSKEKIAIKSGPEETPGKTKEMYDIKTKTVNAQSKTKEKVEIETKPKEAPVKIKQTAVTKTKPKEAPVKIKQTAVTKTKPKEAPVKIKEKVVTMPNDSPVETKEKVPTITKPKLNTVGTYENSTNMPRLFLSSDSTKSLASLNSNIWSLVFNPNAERNKIKKCITRSNETGYCTYIQHCEVPNIATSLEQLIFNGCVMDDVFIGVCCPEFPVETVKVHWEQEPSNPNKQTEDEFGHSVDDCGIRSNEASEVRSWPWKAFLVSMSNGKIFCGGVLISEEYVLTAAHCTTKIPRNQILVRLGQYDESTGDDFVVVEIKRHAQYNPRTMHNDVALLKLGRRITHDQFTRVICLPGEDDGDDKTEGEKAILLGWKGKFGPKPMEEIEFLKVMGKDECRKKLRMNINPTVLCTEARNEDERTCNADSGAPLIIEDDGKYEVIGILSWNRNDCDQRFPATYSRVSTYVRWIRRHAV